MPTGARAVVIDGPGGRGVLVGQSDLIVAPDYSDTFTGNPDGGVVPDLAYGGLRSQDAYMIENAYGNTPRQLVQQRVDTVSPPRPNMSFAADKPGTPGLSATGPSPYPGSSGAGSGTGFTQAGGSLDYGVQYGLRDEYVVQVDAVQTNDRIDISTGNLPGTIGVGSLSVFFRGPTWATNVTHGNNLSLYNGTLDTPLRGQPGFESLHTGLSDATRTWHNYAVRFDRTGRELEIFIDEVSVALVDLNTFAGGAYANFNNAAVGAGGTAGERLWTDNFQVGGVVPEPGAVALLGAPALALLRRRRRE
jgi:hypothetical protein